MVGLHVERIGRDLLTGSRILCTPLIRVPRMLCVPLFLSVCLRVPSCWRCFRFRFRVPSGGCTTPGDTVRAEGLGVREFLEFFYFMVFF